MSINLTQLLLDIQSMRGQLSAMERQVKIAIEEEWQRSMAERSRELSETFAHAPGSEEVKSS